MFTTKIIFISLLFVLLPLYLIYRFLRVSKLLKWPYYLLLLFPVAPFIFYVSSHLFPVDFLIYASAYIFAIHVALTISVIFYLFASFIANMFKLQLNTKIANRIFFIAFPLYLVISLTIAKLSPKITYYEVSSPAPSIHDYKVALLTDFHIGPLLKKEWLENVVTITDRLDPDLVILGGDLLDLEADKAKPYLPLFRSFKNRDGIFPILGNHEYYQGAYELMSLFKEEGIPFLVNETKKIVTTKGTLQLTGIADPKSAKHGGPSPNFELVKKHDQSIFSLVAIHQPVGADQLAPYSNLIVSGHTHGGQIFPFGVLVQLKFGYLSGLYELINHSKLIISSGVGFWGPPLRFPSRGEIVLITINPTKK